jgi:hypothetical protein
MGDTISWGKSKPTGLPLSLARECWVIRGLEPPDRVLDETEPTPRLMYTSVAACLDNGRWRYISQP